ncbi:unnamed protein product, partial [Polarella glacialis]
PNVLLGLSGLVVSNNHNNNNNHHSNKQQQRQQQQQQHGLVISSCSSTFVAEAVAVAAILARGVDRSGRVGRRGPGKKLAVQAAAARTAAAADAAAAVAAAAIESSPPAAVLEERRYNTWDGESYTFQELRRWGDRVNWSEAELEEHWRLRCTALVFPDGDAGSTAPQVEAWRKVWTFRSMTHMLTEKDAARVH